MINEEIDETPESWKRENSRVWFVYWYVWYILAPGQPKTICLDRRCVQGRRGERYAKELVKKMPEFICLYEDREKHKELLNTQVVYSWTQ